MHHELSADAKATLRRIDSVIQNLDYMFGAGLNGVTPFSLCLEIVDQTIDFTNFDQKILDPACGKGSFLLAVIKRFIEAGCSVEQSVRMVYGVDKDESQCAHARVNIQRATGVVPVIDCENSLVKEFDMKFDAIVGNPPYQAIKDDGQRKDQASNLWSLFWDKSISDLSTDGGVVTLITPTSWTSPSFDLRKPYRRLWDIFDSYDSYADVTGVAHHFSGVGSSFGYVVVKKSGSSGLKFSNGEDTSLRFLPRSNYEFVKEHLSRTVDETIGRFKLDQGNRPEPRVAIPLTREVNEDSCQILHGSSDPIGANAHLFIYVYAGNECEAVKKRVIEVKDIINKYCIWSGYRNIQVIRMIKLDYHG